MKTSHILNRNFKNSFAIGIILFAFAAFMSSCQKEELNRPALSNSIPADKSIAQSVAAASDQTPEFGAYEMIVIDHLPGGWGLGQSYRVTVMSNGVGTFEGRKNVGTLGKKDFLIQRETFVYLRNLFATSHFFEINDDIAYVPDAVVIHTSYSDGKNKQTLVDYDLGEPKQLIKLRKITETVLNISKFINSEATIGNPLKDKSAAQ